MAVHASTIKNRIYADFLMQSRLPTYRRLLETCVAAGYRVLSIGAYWDLLKTARIEPDQRYLILRHDIDTDPATARRMWEIEHAIGAGGSFFFRRSTLDPDLIQAISSSGGHVSYHYEELATVAKRHHLRTRAEVDRHLGEAKVDFARNIAELRARFGLPMTIVASHGDFVNRKLGIPNWVILAEPEFRQEVGIELETYDEAIMAGVTSRHSDTLHPRYWIPDDPGPAIARGERVIYLLVHPRHWRVARLVNAKDDAGRAWENLAYALPIRRAER